MNDVKDKNWSCGSLLQAMTFDERGDVKYCQSNVDGERGVTVGNRATN